MNNFILKKTSIITASTLLIISSCIKNKTKTLNIIIPNKYTGWVNIIETNDKSNSRFFEFSDGATCLLVGDPIKSYVNGFKLDNNTGYNIHYYYQDKDTIIELLQSYPMTQVLFVSQRSFQMFEMKKQQRKYEFYSFYVSSSPISLSTATEDVEENKIVELLK